MVAARQVTGERADADHDRERHQDDDQRRADGGQLDPFRTQHTGERGPARGWDGWAHVSTVIEPGSGVARGGTGVRPWNFPGAPPRRA